MGVSKVESCHRLQSGSGGGGDLIPKLEHSSILFSVGCIMLYDVQDFSKALRYFMMFKVSAQY